MHPTRQRAFTLIELLTVIAIIAILAAILMPTLSHVREAARSSQCQSNIRQSAMAILTYAMDNDNRLPSSLYWQGDGRDVGFNGGSPFWGQKVIERGYVETNEVLFCSFIEQRARLEGRWGVVLPWNMSPSGTATQGTWAWAGTYGANQMGAMTDRSDHGMPAHLGDVGGTASRLFLITCSDSGSNGTWGWFRIWGRSWIGYPHMASAQLPRADQMDGRTNMAFADGHVESFSREEIDAMPFGNDFPEFRGFTN